jgi:hypothetical protein
MTFDFRLHFSDHNEREPSSSTVDTFDNFDIDPSVAFLTLNFNYLQLPHFGTPIAVSWM